MSIRIENVKLAEFSMDYFKFGKGANVLVIIPGLSVQSVMGLADAVADAYKSLEDVFTIYVFDRRKELPSEYSVYEMGLDTANAIIKLGLKDICLFGASQGGMIAQVIAIEHPELVSKMVLGSSSANVKPEQYAVINNWVELARKGDREGLYLSFGKEVYPPEVFTQYKDYLVSTSKTVTDEELKRFIIIAEGIKGFNVTDKISSIKCPVMALGSFDDNVLDSDATMEIAEKLDDNENFKLYMYVGYGHAAYDTAPDYRKRLLDFYVGLNEKVNETHLHHEL